MERAKRAMELRRWLEQEEKVDCVMRAIIIRGGGRNKKHGGQERI